MLDRVDTRYARPFWRWYAAILLMLIYSCSMLDRAVTSVVVQPVKAEFHLSDGQIGLLTGFLFGIANGFAGLLVGPFVDRVNRRNFLGGLVAIWSVATAGAAIAPSFALLLGSRLAVGAAEAGAVPASLSILSGIFPPHRRATVTGVFFLSAPLGILLASAGGGYVAGHWGWRLAFLISGAPGLLLCGVMLLTLPEPIRNQAAKAARFDDARGGLISTLGFIVRHPSMAPHFLALILFALAAGGKAGFMIAFYMRVHHIPVQTAGAWLGLIGAGGGLVGAVSGGIIADWLAQWKGRLPLYWLAAVATITGFADISTVLSPTLSGALLATAVSSLVGSMWLGPGYGLAVSFAPEAIRGKALAWLQIGANFATGAGALLVGVLSDLYGGTHALAPALATVFCALFAASGLFALAGSRFREAHTIPD